MAGERSSGAGDPVPRGISGRMALHSLRIIIAQTKKLVISYFDMLNTFEIHSKKTRFAPSLTNNFTIDPLIVKNILFYRIFSIKLRNNTVDSSQ